MLCTFSRTLSAQGGAYRRPVAAAPTVPAAPPSDEAIAVLMGLGFERYVLLLCYVLQ
jgi:hypothetical protein